MSFEDYWADYRFKNKCGLNSPQFYHEKTFDFDEIKLIALHAYNAGRNGAILTPDAADAKGRCTCIVASQSCGHYQGDGMCGA